VAREHGITRVYSWNTYPAPSVRCQIDSACVFSCMDVRVALRLLTVTNTCDFERGGATKPIIGSSRNNGVKNRLDLYQVQKLPSMIMLIVFR